MDKQIKLEESGYIAHLKTSVTFGEHQAMQGVLMGCSKGTLNPATKEYKTDFDGAASIEWSFKKIQTIVIKLVNAEGKDVPLTRKIIEDLPMADGQTLEYETDKILDDIKKKSERTERK